MTEPDLTDLFARAHRVRERIVDICASSVGGHLGGSLSLADILTTLYFGVLQGDPAAPPAPDRDILLLSKGHGAVGLYAALAERGILDDAELAGYGVSGSRLMGHPIRDVPGVRMPAGSLGHGLALANGYALAGRRENWPRRVFVVMGDGELQEGSVWEAAMATAGMRLDHVVAIVDRNGLQITGRTEDTVGLEPLADRWRAFGWAVREVDGHDITALRSGLSDLPAEVGRPTVLIARTVKGRGLPFVENRRESHFARLNPRMHQRARNALASHGATIGGLS
jgi:transketolase